MDNWWVIALIVLGVVVVGALIWLAISRSGGGARTASGRSRQSRGAGRSDAGGATAAEQGVEAPETRPRAAVVVNPTKFDDNNTDRVRAEISSVCREQGWQDPLWLETTEDDPGYGQAREALEQGVDLVCALGGDGTVRTVGSALVDTGVPMGLLPAGTGNLLARNLSLPSNLSQGLRAALTGTDVTIDTGTLRLRRAPGGADDGDAAPQVDPDTIEAHPPTPGRGEGEVEEHVFLVMAGLGFDAEVMANVPGALKKRVGWVAYVVTGLKGLKGRQFKVDVIIDEGGTRLHRRVRSVMVGNVGKLQGGVNLVPQARADDGILDLVLLSPEGLVGWGAVATRLVTRSSRGHQRVDYYTARTLEVSADAPAQIQLDGDTFGEATAMSVTVNPGSLIVRRPA